MCIVTCSCSLVVRKIWRVALVFRHPFDHKTAVKPGDTRERSGDGRVRVRVRVEEERGATGQQPLVGQAERRAD